MQQEFFSKGRLKHNLKHYAANLILIWAAILAYRGINYYAGFLRQETQQVLLCLAIAYTVFGLGFHLTAPASRITRNKGTLFFSFLKKAANFQNMEKEEKVNALFLAVKFFFMPMMINFAFDNYFAIKSNIAIIGNQSSLLSMAGFNIFIFPFILAAMFFIDTAYFSFGYVFDAGFLRNKIRSVEPTLIGWAVTLVCYPPFNSIYGRHITWYANDMAQFGSEKATFIARVILSLLLLGYLSATIALGTKCSNLTNRGIVTKGPYAFIRHPAYVCKNAMWWITLIPVMSWAAFLSMISWTVIYFFRAITEERHLRKDPDYQEYCRKVRHRFIPGVI